MLYGVRICHGSGGYGETRYHVKHSQSMVHALMILKGVYSMHDACDDLIIVFFFFFLYQMDLLGVVCLKRLKILFR